MISVSSGRQLSAELLTHAHAKRVDDGATVHMRAVISFYQQRNAACPFQMAHP